MCVVRTLHDDWSIRLGESRPDQVSQNTWQLSLICSHWFIATRNGNCVAYKITINISDTIENYQIMALNRSLSILPTATHSTTMLPGKRADGLELMTQNLTEQTQCKQYLKHHPPLLNLDISPMTEVVLLVIHY